MLKKNLFFIFSITVVAIATFIIVVNNYNPYESSQFIFSLFYLSLFVTLVGILSLIIFYSKIYIFKNSMIYSLFRPSLRQGVIVSMGIVVTVLLQGLRVLDFWVGIPLLIVIVLIELFFQTKGSST